jgi:peptidoglycan hydrolase CwlO-like protein
MNSATADKNGFFIEVKKHIVSALFGALCVGIPFYFNTNATLKEHDANIGELKNNVKNINSNISEMNLKLQTMTVEPMNLKEQFQDLKTDVKKISDRQDKMYDILLQVAEKK